VKYLMLIYGNEQIWTSLPAADLAELIFRVDAFNTDLRASGELVDVQGLVTRPRSVRLAADGPVVTDGPTSRRRSTWGRTSWWTSTARSAPWRSRGPTPPCASATPGEVWRCGRS
jgi:hypothetical protein